MNKIITQNIASQICNNIPFRALCSFNLFLKYWQSYFQYVSISSSTTTMIGTQE